MDHFLCFISGIFGQLVPCCYQGTPPVQPHLVAQKNHGIGQRKPPTYGDNGGFSLINLLINVSSSHQSIGRVIPWIVSLTVQSIHRHFLCIRYLLHLQLPFLPSPHHPRILVRGGVVPNPLQTAHFLVHIYHRQLVGLEPSCYHLGRVVFGYGWVQFRRN